MVEDQTDLALARIPTELGEAAMLLAATDRRRLSLASLMVWVWPAVRLNQIHFLRSTDGRALAFVTWAYLDGDRGRRIMTDAREDLETEDWNAGLDLWLVDVVSPFGHARPLLRGFRKRLDAHQMAFALRPSRRGGRVISVRL